MAEVLGIEATLNMTIQELQRVIGSSGAYVHPSVIIMIAEFIMSRGTPYGATFTGISRHPGGHLPAATLERAGSVFTKASAMGAAESIDNISSSIVVAARIKIGTGMCDVGYRYIDENGQEKLAVNESIYKSFRRENKEISEGESAANLQELQSILEKNGVGVQFDFNEENKNNVLVSTMVGGGKGIDKKNDVNLSSFVRKVMEPIPEVDKTPVVSPDFSEIMAMLANKGTVITAVQKGESPNVSPVEFIKSSSDNETVNFAKAPAFDEDTEFEVTIAKPRGKTTAKPSTVKPASQTVATARTRPKQEAAKEKTPPKTTVASSPKTTVASSPKTTVASSIKPNVRTRTPKVPEPIQEVEEAPIVKPARRTLADLRKTAKNITLETTDAL